MTEHTTPLLQADQGVSYYQKKNLHEGSFFLRFYSKVHFDIHAFSVSNFLYARCEYEREK